MVLNWALASSQDESSRMLRRPDFLDLFMMLFSQLYFNSSKCPVRFKSFRRNNMSRTESVVSRLWSSVIEVDHTGVVLISLLDGF